MFFHFNRGRFSGTRGYFHRSIISPMLREGRCHAPHPSLLPSLPPSNSNSNRSRTRILELYADYIARVTIGTLSRYENKTRRDPVAASSLPPSRFFPRQQFDERRFFLGDRGEIWRKMGARKRGITICKRTRRSR